MFISKEAFRTIMYSIFILLVTFQLSFGQVMELSQEDMIQYTSKWEGERFPDGRPRVPDDILERMKLVNIEEAWSVLRNEGYDFQFERGWKHVHPGGVLVGRAMTALYMPLRVDVNNEINSRC